MGDDKPLFLEMESEDRAEVRTEMVGSEIPGTETAELTEALQAQTAVMQGQVHVEEQLGSQMEQLLISLNQRRSMQQELLEALHLAAWSFGYGLGSGLDVWAGIATGQEEWSEGEEDKEQGRRCRWNDTLS